MSKRVVIIGGGIIGLCSAYYLRNAGHKVTILDKSDMNSGASYVNAGYLCPSHIIPLAAPGVMKKGIKWMFNSESPLYIKPRLDLDLLRWAWAFNKSCNKKHVNRSAPAIKDICLLSQDLISDLRVSADFNFHYEKKGLFMLCKTEKGLEEEIHMAKHANDLGLSVKEISQSELRKMEPNVKIDAIGATYFECDHHSTPHEFMVELKQYLEKSGVEIKSNTKVNDLHFDNGVLNKVETSMETIESDEVVLAAGSWSYLISKKLGLKLLMQAGKGYRINVSRPTGISIPAILSEANAAVTPMNGFTRFAGTMEISGHNTPLNKIRVNAIAQSVKKYYPEVLVTEEEKDAADYGLRPLSADGLPYIGKSKKCSNLTIATGHAMLGWSMGPATGKLVQEIIDEKKTSMDISLFNPDRKF